MSEPSIIDGLGAFPIIQIGFVGVMAAGAVWAWYSGNKNKIDRGGLPPGSTWFFDGPIVKALESMQGCYRALSEMRTDNARFANERNEKTDEQVRLLRDILEELRRRDHARR